MRVATRGMTMADAMLNKEALKTLSATAWSYEAPWSHGLPREALIVV
jgi:hypothetical protein